MIGRIQKTGAARYPHSFVLILCSYPAREADPVILFLLFATKIELFLTAIIVSDIIF